MLKVVGVRFQKAGKIYYFDPKDLSLKLDEAVVVENSRGVELGYIAEEIKEIPEEEFTEELMPVIRVANKKDLENLEKNKVKEKEAIEKAKELANKYELQMKLVDAEYTLDGTKVIINFTCEDRVDFRDLVKDLAGILKTRIELRQIGVRDKAKEIGGYGSCGRELCCSKFLCDFDSVSINMAKNQNIALNPTKINGVCGRLLCCLKYEDECYKEMGKKLPKIGKKVETEFGEGKVISTDILKQTYRVQLQDKEIVEVDVNEGN